LSDFGGNRSLVCRQNEIEIELELEVEIEREIEIEVVVIITIRECVTTQPKTIDHRP
jgi:hypothetical protein